MFSYWIYTLFTDKHPLHFKVRTAKDKQFVQKIWWDVLPEVLSRFSREFSFRTFWTALQRSPWTAAYSLGENAAAAHRSQGVISPAGKPTFFGRFDLPTEAGMEIEFLHNRVKMAQEHLLRPGPENKGFHGVWKKLINRELSELKPPGF